MMRQTKTRPWPWHGGKKEEEKKEKQTKKRSRTWTAACTAEKFYEDGAFFPSDCPVQGLHLINISR